MKRLIEEVTGGEAYTAEGQRLAENLSRNLSALAKRHKGYDPVDFYRVLKGEVLCLMLEELTENDMKRYNQKETHTL